MIMTTEPKVNILFLGGAKRVSMARKFIASGKAIGVEVAVIGYELSRHCALASVGDIVEGRRWGSAEILEHLHEIVSERGISVMIPFVDGAVEIASRYRRVYGDVFVPAGNEDIVRTMFDKCAAAAAFESAGLPVPATIVASSPCFPMIAKPRHGSASKGIIVINRREEWDNLPIFHADYLFQEYIADREEYTVDCYVDVSDGCPVVVSPRRRLEVSGGEVVSTATVDDPEIKTIATDTLTRLNLRGAVTVQIIRDRSNGRLMVMEVNPRLGGGAVCSVAAGADIPGLIIADALGAARPQSVEARSGILVQRYLDETVFNLHDDEGK